jgi:hypothetical protein
MVKHNSKDQHNNLRRFASFTYNVVSLSTTTLCMCNDERQALQVMLQAYF